MKLLVRIIRARNLAAKDSNGFSDPYVKLTLGKSKAKTATVYKSLNPSWNDEIILPVSSPSTDILYLDCWDEDFLNVDDFLGKLEIPVAKVLSAENFTIEPTWYPLQKKSPRSLLVVKGDIFLGFTLLGAFEQQQPSIDVPKPSPEIVISSDSTVMTSPGNESPSSTDDSDSGKGKSRQAHDSNLRKRIIAGSLSESLKVLSPKIGRSIGSFVTKNACKSLPAVTNEAKLPEDIERMVETPNPSEAGTSSANDVPMAWFDDDLKSIRSAGEFPEAYTGGVVLDEAYGVSATQMNALIFKPGSKFFTEWFTARKTTEVNAGQWVQQSGDGPRTRVVTYMTAPSSLVKSVKATEDYSYARADSHGYVVELSVATPDVPYGNTFRTELQFCISSGEEASSCRLQVSWRANFLQSTMMKGMIENGMRSGIRDTYVLFSQIMSKYAPPVPAAAAADTDVSPLPTWKYAADYLTTFPVIFTLCACAVLPIHFAMSRGSQRRAGLEFPLFDLPDTPSELLYTAAIAIMAEWAAIRVFQFLSSLLQIESDHGKKAKGRGWLLTVTALEAENLAGMDDSGFSDPFLALTCSGRTRNTSVRLQTNNPNWNETLQFEAFDEPPSTLQLEVLDYDGPFATPDMLGTAEVNLVKSSRKELADVWVPLEGPHATSLRSRVHLRVLLTNTAAEMTPKLVEDLSKQMGAIVPPKSAKSNESFQALFSLPETEILISDFNCAVKRAVPLQGRLFLSPRLVCFHSNIFGLRTKFAVMWDDVDHVKEGATVINRLVNPSLTLYLKKGKGEDARAAAYGTDITGRLKIRFFTFVRPSVAIRTVVAMWKNRSLSTALKIQKAIEVRDMSGHDDTDDAPFLGVQRARMVHLEPMSIPMTASQFLSVVEEMETLDRVFVLFGMTNVSACDWVGVECEDGVKCRRSVKYTITRQRSSFASNVSSVQQKWKSGDLSAGSMEEIITLHDVPFGDQFHVETRREIRTLPGGAPASEVQCWVGVGWDKECNMQEKITANIVANYSATLKKFTVLIISEVIAASQGRFQQHPG